MRYALAFLLVLVSGQAFAQKMDISKINNPWRSDAELDTAEKLLADKKYADILTVTDRVIIRNMRNADAHVLAATAWYNLGNFDKAKQEMTTALAIDKAHLGAYVVGGLTALRQDDKDQAQYYLSALSVVCQGQTCPEFKLLQQAIREYVGK